LDSGHGGSRREEELVELNDKGKPKGNNIK
jgi:hypothetical protein